jgi:cytoskeletal protein RodZ
MIKKYKNRKIHKNRQLGRFPLVIFCLILAAILVGIYYWQHTKNSATTINPVRHTNTINYSPPTPQQKAVEAQQKSQIIQNDIKNPNGDSDTSPSPTTSSNLNVTITRVTNATSTQPLSVRTLVTGTTSGTCTATFTMNGQSSISKNTSVDFQATSASCSFDIPASDFTASGNWNMSIIVTSGGQNSAPATQTVEITQ